jgi:hypothetical protein
MPMHTFCEGTEGFQMHEHPLSIWRKHNIQKYVLAVTSFSNEDRFRKCPYRSLRTNIKGPHERNITAHQEIVPI